MSAYANSVQKPERYDVYVRKFRSICMMHGVSIGSRKELPVFLRKLIDDRHLAMDFWGFVGKLSDREGGVLSDDQMLGLIVEGITDSDISEQDGGAQRTIGDLRAMLAGVDIQGPEHRQVEMAPFPKSESDWPQRERQPDEQQSERRFDKAPGEQELDKKLRVHAEELARRVSKLQTDSPTAEEAPPTPENQATVPVEKQTRFASAPAEPERTVEPAKREKPESSTRPERPERFAKAEERLRYAPVVPATPPPQLDEALLRLELTKLVQQYFENIDKRVAKPEPSDEEVAEAAPGTIAPPVTRRSLEEPVSPEEMEELRLRRMGRARLVLEPAPPPVESPAGPPAEDDDVPMRIPLEHYSPPPVYGRAPFLLLLLLIGAGFAMYRDPTLLRKGIALVARQFHSDGRVASSNQSVTPSLPSAPPTPVATEPSQPSALQSALEGTSTPPLPADTPEQKASQSARESRSAENGSDTGSNRKTATDRAVAQTEQAIAEGIASIESSGAVRVNPTVMDENLIVQRVPAYPEAAKSSRVQGDVVMQALISKEGTVKRVQVTEGDSRLRTAAEEAVYKWRYRPYVLNGRPVEVATTVTVNFNLNR